MATQGKKYAAARAKIDRDARYELDPAVALLKEVKFAKFDESVELHVNLGVDPRKADQMVRGACVLPHGTGKTVKIVVFAKGDKAREAREAGADYVGDADLVAKIKDEGWLEFDKAIATPDMMGLVGPIGRILGPRGLMPNPKVGTVTFEVAKAVNELKGGRIEFKVDKTGIIHAPVGKISFEHSQIMENVMALVETLLKMKPSTSKGTYLKSICLATTMSPGIRLDPQAVTNALR